ncbi:unnamed protein product, partial [Nesidiocoris tenuis]
MRRVRSGGVKEEEGVVRRGEGGGGCGKVGEGGGGISFGNIDNLFPYVNLGCGVIALSDQCSDRDNNDDGVRDVAYNSERKDDAVCGNIEPYQRLHCEQRLASRCKKGIKHCDQDSNFVMPVHIFATVDKAIEGFFFQSRLLFSETHEVTK